jgi:hypothetical protein
MFENVSDVEAFTHEIRKIRGTETVEVIIDYLDISISL